MRRRNAQVGWRTAADLLVNCLAGHGHAHRPLCQCRLATAPLHRRRRRTPLYLRPPYHQQLPPQQRAIRTAPQRPVLFCSALILSGCNVPRCGKSQVPWAAVMRGLLHQLATVPSATTVSSIAATATTAPSCCAKSIYNGDYRHFICPPPPSHWLRLHLRLAVRSSERTRSLS